MQQSAQCMSRSLPAAATDCIIAGLMTLAAAKSFGATSLAITDISPQNIALAKTMGATEAYCHPRTATPQEIADHLKKMLSPFGPEIVIDCVGFESTVQTAIRSCCMGGKVVVVGMGQDNMTLPMSTVGVHELDVLGCFRYANTVSPPLAMSHELVLLDRPFAVLVVLV